MPQAHPKRAYQPPPTTLYLRWGPEKRLVLHFPKSFAWVAAVDKDHIERCKDRPEGEFYRHSGDKQHDVDSILYWVGKTCFKCEGFANDRVVQEDVTCTLVRPEGLHARDAGNTFVVDLVDSKPNDGSLYFQWVGGRIAVEAWDTRLSLKDALGRFEAVEPCGMWNTFSSDPNLRAGVGSGTLTAKRNAKSLVEFFDIASFASFAPVEEAAASPKKRTADEAELSDAI